MASLLLMSRITRPITSKTYLFHSLLRSNRLLSTSATRSFDTQSIDDSVDHGKISENVSSNLNSIQKSYEISRNAMGQLPLHHPARIEMMKGVFGLLFLGNGPDWVFDVQEDYEAFYIRVDMPGVSPKGVRVWIEKGFLCFTGDEETEKLDLDDHEYDNTWEVPRKFSSRIELPLNCDRHQLGQMKAYMKYGVLRIVLPKDKAQVEVISVESE